MKKTIVLICIFLICTLCACTNEFQDATYEDKEECLETAIMLGNYQGTVDIIEEDNEFAVSRIRNNMTPLMQAADSEFLSICNYLVSKGAVATGEEFSVWQSKETVSWLIENGADIYYGKRGKTPAEMYICNSDIFGDNDCREIAHMLLDEGIDSSKIDLNSIVKNSNDMLLVRQLLKLAENQGKEIDIEEGVLQAIKGNSQYLLNYCNEDKNSGLIAKYAAAFCTEEVIKALEERGYDFSFGGEEGAPCAALIAAEYNRNPDVPQYLWNKYCKGENSMPGDFYGIAVTSGNFDAADKMEKQYKNAWDICTNYGCDSSLQYLVENGYTPSNNEIISGFTNGNKNCIEFLASKDAYIEALKKSSKNKQDKALANAFKLDPVTGKSLFLSGIKPDRQAIKSIVEKNDLVTAKKIAEECETIELIYRELEYAVDFGFTELVEYILDKDIDINKQLKDNCKDANTYYLIHEAAAQPSTGIIKLLIENGADLKLKDGEGRTALDIARDEELSLNIKLLKLLL